MLFYSICLIYFILPFLFGGSSYTGATFIHLFSLFLYTLWIFKILKEDKIKIKFSYFCIPLVLFITALFFSLYFSKTPSKSLKEFFNILNYILIYFLILNIFSKETSHKFFNIIFIGLFLVLLYTFYQKFYGYPSLINELQEKGLPYPTRFSALFIHPNSLAGYIILIFPNLVSFGVLSDNRKIKFFYFVLCMLSIISFLFTKSHAGFLCLCFSIFIFILCISKNKINVIKFFSIILLLIFLLTFAQKEKQKSFIGRLHFAKGAINITRDHPLFGSGIDSYSEILPNYQSDAFYSKYAHNNYLQTAAELGFFGLFAYLWLIIFIIKSYISILKNKFDRKIMITSAGLFSSISGFLLHTFFDFDWNIPAITFLFFSNFAIMEIIANRTKILEFAMNKVLKLEIKIATVFLCLLFSIVIIKPYLSYLYFECGKRKAEEKNFISAKLNFEKAINLYSKNPYYFSELANIYFQTGNKKQAIEKVKSAIALSPYSAYFYSQIGTYYFETGDIKNAISSFSTATSLYKNCATYYYVLGGLYQKDEKFKNAEIEYKKAISLIDKYIFAGQNIKDIISSYAELSKLYLLQNKIKEAKHIAKETLKYDKDNKVKFILNIKNN